MVKEEGLRRNQAAQEGESMSHFYIGVALTNYLYMIFLPKEYLTLTTLFLLSTLIFMLLMEYCK